MDLIEGDRELNARTDAFSLELTRRAYRRALAPIKAFRTRQGADFLIVEA